MSATVLLCAPSIRTGAQQKIFQTWCDALVSSMFHVETVDRANYTSNPWQQLTRLMTRVDGVVILGLRQMEICNGLWRNGTPEMLTVKTVWTSPWVQVEGGMAVASDLPVLVAPERGVSEGIFAPQNWTTGVFGVAAEEPKSTGFGSWAAAVRETNQRRQTT